MRWPWLLYSRHDAILQDYAGTWDKQIKDAEAERDDSNQERFKLQAEVRALRQIIHNLDCQVDAYKREQAARERAEGFKQR